MKFLSILVALAFLAINAAWAADKDGKFAAKGAGRKSCEQFLIAKKNVSQDYLLYAGWLEGYVSAYNRFQKSTYDITPWQTTELLLSMTEHHCKSNPASRILSVTDGLMKALFPARLESESTIVELNVMNRKSYFYAEIIKQVKARLEQLGFYSGDVESDHFGRAEIEAMRLFQQKSGLRETGIPDQYSLSQLFLRLKK